MLNYLLRKSCILLLSLLLIMTITFLLIKVMPGNPFIQDQELPKEILTSLYSQYGFDKPIYIQYLSYLKNCFSGHFGSSYIYLGRKVESIIIEGLPITALLGFEALIYSLFFGISLGCISAFYRSRWLDLFCMVIALVGISIPGFLLATFLQYSLAIKLNLLPMARWGSFSHTILPALSLAATPTAFITRLTRANMIEVLNQDYIKTAYGKGLSSFRVLYKHAIRNAILPVISYIGPASAQILTGSFVIEKIFSISGMGQWLTLSISNRDYPVILGITLFYSCILLVTIFLIDILYGIIDPRIRVEKISK